MSTKTPYRQIRALYDQDTVTVYQAYNSNIADAAVATQKLDASPLFKSRMTWIKPSWTWVNYRAGYSYKDKNQERILAIKMTHDGFLQMLRMASLTTHRKPEQAEDNVKTNYDEENEVITTTTEKTGFGSVRVQWDPERSVRIGKLDYRSIQIGVPASLVGRWINEWIVSIEDVTEKARELKRVVDEDKNVKVEDLISRGLVPVESVYHVPDDVRTLLQMDVTSI